jgi:LPS export ABC transporter protein LptC
MEEQKPKARAGGLNLKPWLKPWPIYMIAVAVVGGGVYFTRAQREAGHADPILPANVQLQQNIEIQFSDVIMQGRQRGVQRWTITSPKVSLSKDSRYTYFEPDPKGEFYNLKDWNAPEPSPGASPPPDTKTRSMTWTARKAEFDSFTEDLTIQGKAVITTDTKDVIKTEKVEYKSRSKYVYMPKPVDITTKTGTHVKADSLKANADAEVFELTGHVDMTSNVNDEEKL